MTVTKIKSVMSSGTATVTVKTGAATIKAGVSVTTSVATDSTITNPALTEDQVLQIDVTATTGTPLDLLVEVQATEVI